MNKIILQCPNYKDSVFDSYEDLNIIWQIIENYKDCKLVIVYDNNESEDNKEGD